MLQSAEQPGQGDTEDLQNVTQFLLGAFRAESFDKSPESCAHPVTTQARCTTPEPPHCAFAVRRFLSPIPPPSGCHTDGTCHDVALDLVPVTGACCLHTAGRVSSRVLVIQPGWSLFSGWVVCSLG